MNTNMPKVSILVISYNEKKYLSQAIDSCISQTYPNKEIIIGDDGSTDGSVEFIRGFGDGIRHFIMERDAGPIIPSIRVSNLIKRGIDESDGEYFAILSGDDYYIDDNMISDAIEFLKNNQNYVAYVNGLVMVDHLGNVIDKNIPQKQSNAMYWSGPYIHISCFIFKKPKSNDLLQRFCDDTGLEYVLAEGKWKYGNKITFAYRQREKSIQHILDQLELSIAEAMLLQDILNYSNTKKFYFSSLSRFYRPIKYLSEHTDELSELRYSKYLENCAKYDNNVIQEIIDGKIAIKKMWLCNRWFAFCHKFFAGFRRLKRLIEKN